MHVTRSLTPVIWLIDPPYFEGIFLNSPTHPPRERHRCMFPNAFKMNGNVNNLNANKQSSLVEKIFTKRNYYFSKIQIKKMLFSHGSYFRIYICGIQSVDANYLADYFLTLLWYSSVVSLVLPVYARLHVS